MTDTPITFLTNTRQRFLSMLRNEEIDFKDGEAFSQSFYIATHCCAIKQDELAKFLEAPLVTVSRWVHGKQLPSKYNRPLLVGQLEKFMSNICEP